MKGSLARVSALVLVMVAASAGAGCMVPSYQLPAGFSSTYQRQLYGMEPVCAAQPQEIGLAAIETRRGIFYPMTVYREPTEISNNQKDGDPLEPMFLGWDPLSTRKTARRNTPDAT